MTSSLLSRRLVLPAGEVGGLCARLALPLPADFAATPTGIATQGLLLDGQVHPSVAAGLRATCAPRVGVLLRSTAGDVAAALGVRGDLGGSLVRVGSSDVEVAAWPAERLGVELVRTVPDLGGSARPALHGPLVDLAAAPELRDGVLGVLRATVVAPPYVVGLVTWLATDAGWLALEPAEVRDGVLWARVRPVHPGDIAAAVAPFVAGALS